jgi:SAM-dependent methyltransferase
VSAVGLFLELMLIRWISSEIRIFAYFKNLVLIACFFGFGIGCYLSRKRIQLLYVLLPLPVLVLLTALPWQPLQHLMLSLSAYIGGLADVHVFGRHYDTGFGLYAGAAVAFSVIIPVIAFVTLPMIPFGQLVARYLETARAGIAAYSVNVAASVVGIWLYTGLCFMSTGPLTWFLVLGVGMLLLFWILPRQRMAIVMCFVVTTAIFLAGRTRIDYQPDKWFGIPAAVRALKVNLHETYWSPYQKLTLTSLNDGEQDVRWVLNTNGSWYQDILNLSPEFVKRHPAMYPRTGDMPGVGNLQYHRYNLPYRFAPEPENVLVLGAGMGNDIAAALRNGAHHVVAVEIDPFIYRLGEKYHPERPYSDPRVHVVIDDARHYIQNSPERFDLIVSSILDSHTTQSSFTNIRTDNYVYTQEAIAQMRKLLKPGGVLSLSFSSERGWFAGRLKQLLTDSSGHPPLILLNGAYMFLVGDHIPERLQQDPALRAFVESRTHVEIQSADPTTDDWPYFYQRDRGVPFIVVLLSCVLIAICWMVLQKSRISARKLEWHFFFLGAGFMLMEVQIISKLALLFGTTWLVNSIVISILLFLILLANLTTSRFPRAAEIIGYPGLFLTLAVSFLLPMQLLVLPSWTLRGAATLLLCSPVYFAGLIFVSSFARYKFQAEAFGSNLFGSLVGGLLEAISFWTGIRSLVIVAAGCYALSAVLRRKPAAIASEGAELISAQEPMTVSAELR